MSCFGHTRFCQDWKFQKTLVILGMVILEESLKTWSQDLVLLFLWSYFQSWCRDRDFYWSIIPDWYGNIKSTRYSPQLDMNFWTTRKDTYLLSSELFIKLKHSLTPPPPLLLSSSNLSYGHAQNTNLKLISLVILSKKFSYDVHTTNSQKVLLNSRPWLKLVKQNMSEKSRNKYG